MAEIIPNSAYKSQRENMIRFIEIAVSRNPDLSVKEIQGEHHRIMKTKWFGSLWIVKTARRGYRLETTGDVATRLNSEIRNLLGRDFDKQTVKGYKVWFVETASDVEKIIGVYGQM